jgi:hypothetical protein
VEYDVVQLRQPYDARLTPTVAAPFEGHPAIEGRKHVLEVHTVLSQVVPTLGLIPLEVHPG